MAAEKVKKKRVGNAALYIGLPWEKRKSLPRDSRGFEPLDGYFLKSKDESDSDSSETDTEELIRQEMIKRKEERRAKLEARKKAEGEATVTNEAHVNGSTGEGERAMEMEDRAADKTVTLLSHDNHTAVSEAGCSQHVSREELYSPQKSVLAVSPHEQQMKVMPSRLRFSSSPGESASEGAAAAADTPQSTERKRKKYRRSVVCKSPRKSTSKKVLTTITVEPGDSNHVGGGAGESTRTLANGVQHDTALESVASSKSFMNATDKSFRPTKTSTRRKPTHVERKQKPSARKQISSIHPIMQVSDSESEDEMLTSLLGNRNQSDVFQGLNQLTHSRSAMATKEKPAPANRQQAKPKPKQKRKTEKSDVEATASEQSEEDTRKESRRLVRKSVTFVDVAPLSASPQSRTSGKSGPAKKPSIQNEDKAAEQSVDVYDFPQLEDDSPPRSSPVKKSKETESRTLSKTASNESLKSGSPKKTATEKRPRSPRKTASKRKSILKEVSVVVRKEPSPLNISQGQWFIPNDISSMLTAKTSKTNVSQHTRSRLQHSSEDSANSSGSEEERNTRSTKRRQTQSQEQTLPSKNKRKRASKKSVASNEHTGQEEAAVEDAAVEDDVPPATNSTDGFEGPSRVSGLEDSTGSQKGRSALNEEVEGGAGYSGIAESRRPNRRKRSSRVVLGSRAKWRKKESSTAKTGEENQFLSDEEEAGVGGGLEITYSAGGRRYRRLRVQPSKSHTPGVRRSKRTRIAPVRTWENEEVEYDTRRRSGAVIRGVLVPMEDSTVQRKRRRAAKVETESEDEEEFPPVIITDKTGKVLDEKFVVKTLSSHEAINSQGEPAEKWDDVVITRLHSTPSTSNGRILFRSLGEKDRSRAGNYEMFFYVLKGKLLFKINAQEYRLKPQMEIQIPAKTVYSIRNLQRSHAEVFFYTHLVTEENP